MPRAKGINKFLLLVLISFLQAPIHPCNAEDATVIEPTKPVVPFSSGDPVKQVNHTFWIKFSDAESKLHYKVAPSELLMGAPNGIIPNIRIVGTLALKSNFSVNKCLVRLPSYLLKAQNDNGETIDIQLRGTIGTKTLSTEFVNPDFDDFNEAHFVIEGFIDQASYLRGLSPGEYNFKQNLKLIVEFQD
jgi:hypothetical protein